MRIPIKKIVVAAACAVVSYHFTTALDLIGAKEHFAALTNWLPATLMEFIARSWVLAFSTFILGMVFADWMIRRTVNTETRPDRITGMWLNHKKRMLLLGLRHPRFVPLDLRYELATMNTALTAPGIDMPPLPATDPAEARIGDTRLYLSSIGSLSPRRLPEARRIARAIIEAAPMSPSSSVGLVRRFREAAKAMLGTRGGRR